MGVDDWVTSSVLEVESGRKEMGGRQGEEAERGEEGGQRGRGWERMSSILLSPEPPVLETFA